MVAGRIAILVNCPVNRADNQYGTGCLSDGILGAWIAEMCALPPIANASRQSADPGTKGFLCSHISSG